jgi:hypothetical protein
VRDSDLTPAQVVARDRVHDLLAELVDLVGPAFDGAGDIEPGEGPVGQVFLSEWALVASWVDEDGDGFITRITSANLPAHHLTGLLHEGLYGFDD